MVPEVLYIVERFPTYSETFIHDEIANHLESGLDVQVVVLTGSDRSDFPLADCIDAVRRRVTYLDIPANKAGIVRWGLVAALRGGFLTRLWAAKRKLGVSMREALFGSIIAERFPHDAILHCHFGNIGRIGLAARFLSKGSKKLFVTFHAHEMTRQWFLPLDRYYASLFRSDAKLLPISDHWRSVLIEAGADPQRTEVHHMGVKIRPERNGRPTSNGGAVKLVMVGRMVQKKGHIDAVESMIWLKQRGISVECDFIGDGPVFSAIESQIKILGLTDRVRLRGSLPHEETLRLVEAADIFLLPSVTAVDGDMEGIPVSLMEAMAREIPVISTYHSGIPELIEDGVSGLLVPERSPEELAKAIATLAADPQLRARLAAAGRLRVEEWFNGDRQSKKLQQQYQDA